MFKKKKCANCHSKIKSDFEFCPSCGMQLNPQEKKPKRVSQSDFGVLGENDFEFPEPELQLPMGLGTIVNSLMKNIQNEMESLEKQNKKPQQNPNPNSAPRQRGFSFSISSFGGPNGPRIQMKEFGMPQKIGNQNSEKNKNKNAKQIHSRKIPLPKFTDAQQKKFAELESKTPETNIRRLSDKLIYEIKLPQIKSQNEISITQLKDSIEIKAISKTKSYFKSIQINFPLTNFHFEKEVLTLEMGVRN